MYQFQLFCIYFETSVLRYECLDMCMCERKVVVFFYKDSYDIYSRSEQRFCSDRFRFGKDIRCGGTVGVLYSYYIRKYIHYPIQFDTKKNDWKVVHCEVFGKSGCRRIVPGQYLAADPKGRAILIGTHIDKCGF